MENDQVTMQVVGQLTKSVQAMAIAIRNHEQRIVYLHAKVHDLHKRLVAASAGTGDPLTCDEGDDPTPVRVEQLARCIQRLGESEIPDSESAEPGPPEPPEPSRLVTP